MTEQSMTPEQISGWGRLIGAFDNLARTHAFEFLRTKSAVQDIEYALRDVGETVRYVLRVQMQLTEQEGVDQWEQAFAERGRDVFLETVLSRGLAVEDRFQTLQ